MKERQLEQIMTSLDEDDLIGQLLCYDIYDKDDPAEVEEIVSKLRPGGIFLSKMSREKIEMYTNMANKYTKVPVIVVVDCECGPGADFPEMPTLPNVMAWGACDDAELIEKAAELMAKICRLHGMQWTLSPVVDINFNPHNPLVNTRAASDSPQHVVKIMGAFLRGIQKNGYMVASLKHFPGDGMDDRNQHFCTASNTLDMESWYNTYGYVYREMIKLGAASVMSAHISLSSYANERDEVWEVPGTISKPLMTDLLRGELGFDGAIISDAMSMVGVAARIHPDDLGSTFIRCGGDMILFNEPDENERLKAAISAGNLTKERVLDAVRRVLRVKMQARLFEKEEDIRKEIGESEEELLVQFQEVANEIAEKSIKIVRDYDNLLPIKPKENARFLCINMRENDLLDTACIEEELKKRGYHVDTYHKINHHKLHGMLNDYDYILINCFFKGDHGSTMKVGWRNIEVFWRGYVLKHPRVIFTSFGDPYKLYEFSFLRTYINTFSYRQCSMEAFIKVLLGEVEAQAKNPISLEGFFEREV